MSWSAAASKIRKDQITAIEATPQTAPEGCEEAFAEQLAAAIECAEHLAAAVGGDDALVNVSMGGHANPDHASDFEGWADETVHVSVSVAR